MHNINSNTAHSDCGTLLLTSLPFYPTTSAGNFQMCLATRRCVFDLFYNRRTRIYIQMAIYLLIIYSIMNWIIAIEFSSRLCHITPVHTIGAIMSLRDSMIVCQNATTQFAQLNLWTAAEWLWATKINIWFQRRTFVRGRKQIRLAYPW